MNEFTPMQFPDHQPGDTVIGEGSPQPVDFQATSYRHVNRPQEPTSSTDPSLVRGEVLASRAEPIDSSDTSTAHNITKLD